MNDLSRFSAVAAYVPIIGWLYVYVFQRKNELANFHLKQSIGLVLFLVSALVSWAVVAWGLAWIPYMGALGMALFTLVMAAYVFGAVAWILGLIHSLRGQMVPLPWFGSWATRLPIR
jgi:uncharacterized membrane protein